MVKSNQIVSDGTPKEFVEPHSTQEVGEPKMFTEHEALAIVAEDAAY